jgi:predicted nucleic acid-binding protein
LRYENSLNPFRDRREAIGAWQALATHSVNAEESIVQTAERFETKGLSTFDALHVACAKHAGALLFITTDDRLRRVALREKFIDALLPQEALARLEGWYEN